MSETPIIDAEVTPVTKTAAPEVAPVEAAPTARPKTRKWWQVWKSREKQPKRALLSRLFGIGIWGTIKLLSLCILVGFVLLAMDFDPAAPGFDVTNALGAFLQNALTTARWAATNFWKPALAGASIVMPLWVLWRLATLPFRR